MTISILSTEVRSQHDVTLVRQRARQIAAVLKFDAHDQARIATAVSEIARNTIQHANGGKVEFKLSEAGGGLQALQVLVSDNGPGIAQVAEMLRKKDFSSGRGKSLRGVMRLMDVCNFEANAPQGTKVTLCKNRPRQMPVILLRDMAQVSQELALLASEDPLAEVHLQNQELLHTLEALRVQQEERHEHLQEIEKLNARLKRSVRATHHRVKNNLQIISALAEVQVADGMETVPIAAMHRISQHARALAALHDMLTRDTQAIFEQEAFHAKEALGQLMPLLQATTGGRAVRFDVDDMLLSVAESTSLALLISELVSNALKHGSGDIEVTLQAKDGTARLEVSNDGPGFPPDFDWREAANTGLAIVDSTGRHDLKGVINYENRPEGGARVIVEFPLSIASGTAVASVAS